MVPWKLKMKAFGSFKEEREIPFSKYENNLFLIAGDTGAGKTTIFDAIVFSLYGTLSGSEKTDRAPKMMHSDLCPKSEPTEVSLVFRHQGREYTVERSIRFPKKRSGEYEDTPKFSAVLYEPNGAVVKNSTEVDKRIKEIIGLDEGQFRKIVMLAQGEFKHFLKANSSVKGEILGKLFDNSVYVLYENLFRKAAAKLEKSRKDSVETIYDIMKNSFEQPEYEAEEYEGQFKEEDFIPDGPDLLDSLIKLISFEEEKEHGFASFGAGLAKQKDAVISERSFASNRNQELAALERLQETRKALVEQQDVIAELDTRCENVEKVIHHIIPKKKAVQEAGERLVKLEKERQDTEKELLLFETEKEKLSIEMEQDDEKKKKSEELALILKTLVEQKPKYEELTGIDSFLESKNALLLSAENQKKSLDAAMVVLQNDLEQWKQKLNLFEDAERNVEIARQTAEKASEKVEAIRSHIKKRNLLLEKLAILQKRIVDYQNICTEASKAAEVFHDLYQRFLSGQAGILGSELTQIVEKQGSGACPVCKTVFKKGMTFDFAKKDAEVPDEDSVNRAKQAAEQTEKRRADAESAMREEKSRLDEGCRGLVEQHHKLDSDCTDWEHLSSNPYLEQQLQTAEAQDAAAKKVLEQAIRSEQEKDQLQKRIEEGEKIIEEKRDESQRNQEAISQLSNAISAAGSRKEEIRNNLKYESLAELESQYRVHKQEKDEIDRILSQHESREKDLGHQIAKKKGELESLRGRIPELEKAIQIAENELELQLEKDKFASLEDALSILEGISDPENWLVERKEEVRIFRENLFSTNQRVEELRKKTADWVKTDLDEFDSKIRDLEAKLNQNQEKEKRIHSRIDSHRSVYERVMTQKKLLAKTDHAYATLSRMSDIAGGSSREGGKLTFSRYIMSAIFCEILDMANIRLDIMSGGEYELRHKMEADRDNAAAGFDLQVYSHTTGLERDSASLSGGESFITSLALAFGLSDVVKAHSGGLEMDTLFIDEGFGTLDEEKLQKVMTILRSMSASGNMIGIISHIGELDHVISKKIIVTNEKEKGSNVTFVER